MFDWIPEWAQVAPPRDWGWYQWFLVILGALWVLLPNYQNGVPNTKWHRRIAAVSYAVDTVYTCNCGCIMMVMMVVLCLAIMQGLGAFW